MRNFELWDFMQVSSQIELEKLVSIYFHHQNNARDIKSIIS